ncbi:MAG: hypothetical protein EOP47_17840 [Sphingobacteriaceae bacterium]|nr:MAG: hypothetical protein EOP47_17840 [Sphingobacteriaceae bacterium]
MVTTTTTDKTHTPLHINDLTLMITHFNRTQSLRRLLSTLKNYRISFDEIIVSDGGSNPENLQLQCQQNK